MSDVEGNYILAHDLGTTGDKAVLYDRECELQASHFYGYETLYPRPNWVEQDPVEWWEAVKSSTAKLLAQTAVSPDQIAAVGFSGQMMGCLPVDREGNPLRKAIIWADQRAVKEAAGLKERVGSGEIYRTTGHRGSASYSAAKIMWIKEHEPDLFRRTNKFLQAKDFVIFKLTGKFRTDYSDASGTNLFDLEGKAWSSSILRGAGITEEKLPQPLPSTEIVGTVLPDAAEETGLDPATPVVIGGGDGSCAAVGAGVTGKGEAYNYLGSSSWIGLATEKPIYDEGRRTFNWVHLDPEKYSPCGTMQSAGGSLQWAKENLAQLESAAGELLEREPYNLIDLQAEKSPAGAKGLLFLPYLLGERAPRWNPNARGSFIGLTPRHKKGDIFRAILEGVCLNLRVILEIFQKGGARIEEMRLIGGGAKSDLWPQIMADVLGKPVLPMHYLEEATSLGAAIAAGVGVGLFPGFEEVGGRLKVRKRLEVDPGRHELYDELFQIFEKSYCSLEQVFDQIAQLQEEDFE